MADDSTTRGIAALKAGDKLEARQLLRAAVARDPNDEAAWLWLSGAVESDAERAECLRHVVAINPGNTAAQRGLQALTRQNIPPQIRLKPIVRTAPPPATFIPGPFPYQGEGKTEVGESQPTAWYRQPWPLLILFVLVTPAWAWLVLSDRQQPRRIKIFAALVMGVYVPALCALLSTAASVTLPGETAPDFTLKDLNGYSYTLSGLRGHVVVLNVWATWCGPCRSELPDLAALHNAYRAQGLIVLGVNSGEDTSTVSSFLKNNWLPYTVLLDTNGHITRQYGVRAYPTTFFIDRKGVRRSTHVGTMSFKRFEAAVKPLLTEQP